MKTERNCQFSPVHKNKEMCKKTKTNTDVKIQKTRNRPVGLINNVRGTERTKRKGTESVD